MTRFRPAPSGDTWRVRVTEGDIRAARTAWWDARQRGDSPARVVELWDDLVRLFRTEAEQVAHELWAGEGRRTARVPQQRGMTRVQ